MQIQTWIIYAKYTEKQTNNSNRERKKRKLKKIIYILYEHDMCHVTYKMKNKKQNYEKG
jgi:hypothetical protein